MSFAAPPRHVDLPCLAGVCRLGLATRGGSQLDREAERDIFPVTTERRLPVVAFTCLRWGALLEPTPDDPPGFVAPRAADWYRFVLCQPAVAVALMAPDNASELAENLKLLDDWRGPHPGERETLLAHGDRVRRHAPSFP